MQASWSFKLHVRTCRYLYYVSIPTRAKEYGVVPVVKGCHQTTLLQVPSQLRVVRVVGCKGQLVAGWEYQWASDS